MEEEKETLPAQPQPAQPQTAQPAGGAKKRSTAAAAAGAFAWIFGIAAGCVCGWLVRDMMPAGTKEMAPPKMDIATVAAVPAAKRPYNRPTRYVAHVEAMQEVDLLPQVDGYIKSLNFAEGAMVKEGDLLYELIDERYQAVVSQREADLEAAKAEQRRADKWLERTKNTKQGVIPDSDRETAEAGAEKARAAVLQAKANLVVARYDLEKTKIYAPISGQIGKSSAHKGDYVSPAKGPLAHIVQTDPIRVKFPMTDRDYIALQKSAAAGAAPGDAMRMRLVLPDGTEYGREGKTDFGDNKMSVETATVQMRLSFPNEGRLLLPDSFVTLLADHATPPEYICVPQTAITDSVGGGTLVYVLKKDMTVEARPVKTLDMHEGWVPVVEGLSEGERVVVAGTGKLRPGMKVALAKATPNEENTPGYKPALAAE